MRRNHARSPGAIVCSSGSKPPVADSCVIEGPRAARETSHQSLVGSQLVIASCYSTRLWWAGPVSAVGATREGMGGAADYLQRSLVPRSRLRQQLTPGVAMTADVKSEEPLF
jgi:hypothetical protein